LEDVGRLLGGRLHLLVAVARLRDATLRHLTERRRDLHLGDLELRQIELRDFEFRHLDLRVEGGDGLRRGLTRGLSACCGLRHDQLLFLRARNMNGWTLALSATKAKSGWLDTDGPTSGPPSSYATDIGIIMMQCNGIF